jgi:WD40 repeat protein
MREKSPPPHVFLHVGLILLIGTGFVLFLALTGSVLACELAAPSAPRAKKRTDHLGDPLPAGVLTRIASSRMRHNDRVRAMAISPNGRLLATGGGYRLRVWDTATGKLKRQFEIGSSWGHKITFSTDSLILTSVDGYHDLTCRRFDLGTGKELSRFHLDLDDDADLSADGTLLAVACDDQIVRLFDTATGRKTGQFKIPLGGSNVRVALRPDGKTLAVTDSKNTSVRIYDLPSGNLLVEFPGETAPFSALLFSHDGRSLVAHNGKRKEISIWDPATGKARLRLNASLGDSRAFCFSRDDKVLAIVWPEAPDVVLWDLTTGQQVRRISTLSPAKRLQLAPDGKTVFAESRDGAILAWDVESGKVLPVSANPITSVRELRFDASGKRLIGCTDVFRAWDSATGRELRAFPHAPGISALSPDERLLASSSANGSIRLLDAATGREIRSWEAHARALWVLQFSADGKRLFSTGGWDPRIAVWDVAQGSRLRELPANREGVTQLAVSPNGRFLASVGNPSAEDGDLRIWDLDRGCERYRLAVHLQAKHYPVFSPDGRWLAAASGRPGVRNSSGEVQVWEVLTGRLLGSLTGHKEQVTALAFSVDSRMLASGSQDRTVRLWDLASRQECQRLQGHEGTILSLAFSPDNLRLAASSPDAPVYIWDVAALTQRDRPSAMLTDAQVEALWTDLADEEPRKGYPAGLALAAAPAQTLPLLCKNLQAASPPDKDHLKKLLADLNSDQFAAREQASHELEKLGESAGPALQKALAERPAPEMRRRLEELLEKLEQPPGSPERLRVLRAIAVLEYIGNAEARRILKQLADGMPDARMTQEAKQALERLAKRNRP